MKHLKGFKLFETKSTGLKSIESVHRVERFNESYNSNTKSKLDDILDKIQNGGFESLTDQEKNFLKSFKSGDPNRESEEMDKIVYKDDWFRFEVDHIGDDGERKIYQGELTIRGGESYKGSIYHYHHTGMIDFNFDVSDGELTIWDKVEGIEHEFDNFVQDFLAEQEGV